MNSESASHVYGYTASDWATGKSVADVLVTLAKKAGKRAKGTYARTYTVGAPISAKYKIENYKPQGVPLSDSQEWVITNTKGAHAPY